MSSLLDEHETDVPRDSTRLSRDRRRRARRRLVATIAVVALVIVIGVVGWISFGDRLMSGLSDDDFSGEGNGTAVAFTVEDGDTGTSIGARLADAGIVKTGDAFVAEVISRDPEPTFMPGTFEMQERMSAAAAVDALLDNSNLLADSFVVPEGSTMADIFSIIDAGLGIPVADLEAAAADVSAFDVPAEATTLEGFLFPATYDFAPGVDAATVLHRMVDRSIQALDAAGVAPEDRWETIRLASVVEREAGLRDDFYRVARVFLNRFEIGMPMQADSTITYYTGDTDRIATTDAERADAENPYNTYVHAGLVVAPISNPGDLAIDASVNPADGEWLYFVTWNLETGETTFSNTYEEHLQAVDVWMAWMDEHPEYW